MRTRRNNDRMLLESLVRKYGKNGVRKAINEMKDSFNPIQKYIKYGEPTKGLFIGGENDEFVLPENYIRDVERFLGKRFNDCLSFWEGHYGPDNEEGYDALSNLSNGNIIKTKKYVYIDGDEDDIYSTFDVDFCNYNGFKFITQGGYGDDYCAIC